MTDSSSASGTRLVVVTGPGRSGTSSVTGALQLLGLTIPEPVKPPDEGNLRGYFEPEWVVDFHERHVNAIPVRTLDSRPYAADIAVEHAREAGIETELRTWLTDQVGPAQLLVKDPRLTWIHPVWVEVADELDLSVVVLAMLRHPTEVVGSRDSAYLTQKEERFRRQRAIAHIAAWVNVILETERITRGRPRAFVRYHELLADWRAALGRAGDQLGLAYDADLAAGTPHAVDDFVDPALHRSRITWDDLDVPAGLRDLAERTWQAVDRLVEAPDDASAAPTFDALRTEYADLHLLAESVAMDVTTAEVAKEKDLRNKRVGRLRRQVEQLEAQVAQHSSGAEAPAAGTSPLRAAARAVRRRTGR